MAERTRPEPDQVTSVTEARVALGTLKELGEDYETAVVDSFVARLGDQIDDRVARSFDEQFAERLAEPGPIGRALARERRTGLALVLASLALGATATILSSGGATALSIVWTGIVAINLVYFFRRN
jgi:hypothetical protein